MPNIESVYKQAITAGGGTINLPVTEAYTRYRFYTSGTVTLAGNWVIQESGTPVEGTEYRIIFDGSLILGSNTLTIFGLSVPDSVALENFEAIAYYNGSAWEVKVLMDFTAVPYIATEMLEDLSVTTAKINDLGVTTAKINALAVTSAELASNAVTTNKITDGNVTTAKVDSDLKTEFITVPVSFETGEQARNEVTIPYAFTLVSATYSVTKAIAATDDATISYFIDGVATTAASITITASTAIDSTASTVFSGNNTGSADGVVRLTSAKATAGGKALVTLKITRR